MVFYYIYLSSISSSEPIDFIPSFRALFPHIDVFVEQPEHFTGKLRSTTVKISKELDRDSTRKGKKEGRTRREKGREGGMMKSSFMLYILCMKISDPESRCYCDGRRKEDPRLSAGVCELTFFMDTDSTETPGNRGYARGMRLTSC